MALCRRGADVAPATGRRLPSAVAAATPTESPGSPPAAVPCYGTRSRDRSAREPLPDDMVTPGLRAEGISVPNAIAAFLLRRREATGTRPHDHFGRIEGMLPRRPSRVGTSARRAAARPGTPSARTPLRLVLTAPGVVCGRSNQGSAGHGRTAQDSPAHPRRRSARAAGGGSSPDAPATGAAAP